MRFLYPFALLGLIAIPILIIIYIIRSKYKEVTSPTTYIWEVAAKMFKRKNPLSRFEHLLALIVQMTAIAILSIALAHPVFTLKEAADDIVFVLDGSSSMSLVHDGSTRFEKAKKLISEKAEKAPQGSTFTLLLAEKEPRLVCQKVDDFSRFQMYLDSVSYSEDTSALSDAIAEAQVLFSNGEATLCYLASDQNCGEMSNIKFLDVSDDEENYAVTSLNYTLEAKQISFTGTITSYASDADLNIDILVNGGVFSSFTYNVVKGEPYSFATEAQAYTHDVQSVTLNIKNADGLMSDNTYTVYANDTAVNTRVLVVSSAATYLRAYFDATKGAVTYNVIAPAAYHDNTGYDLYIFDSYAPATLPNDGAVFFFGLNRTVPGSGFATSGAATPVDSALKYSDSETLLYQQLTKNTVKRDIVISTYQRYSLSSNFTTILTCDNVPVVFAGRNENGQRQIVFAFDLHNSNLPLLFDYVALMRNFIDYANPRLMTNFDYEIGESAILTVPDEVTNLNITLPDGKSEPIHYGKEEAFSYELTQVGTYTLTATFGDGTSKVVRFYSHNAYKESDPHPAADGTYGMVLNESRTRADGIWDNILPIVIAAALFFAGDWILYAHEQY